MYGWQRIVYLANLPYYTSHTQYAWTAVDGWCRFKFSKLLSSSFDVQITCWCRPLLAENDLDVWLHGTLHVVPQLPRNSWFVDNTFLPSRWRFRVQARIIRLDSVSAFNVHVASLSDYDHLRGFQYFNTNSHVRNLSFLTLNQRFEPINGSSHLLTWNYIL